MNNDEPAGTALDPLVWSAGALPGRLTSRPRETSSVAFLTGLLVLFRYLANSGDALLGGVLPMRYRAASFALGVLTWRLPLWKNVAGLITEEGEEVVLVHVAPYPSIDAGVAIASGGAGGNRAGGPAWFWKRVRLSRKTPAHLVCQDGLGRQSRLRLVLVVKQRGGVCFSMMRAFQLSMTGWGLAESHQVPCMCV